MTSRAESKVLRRFARKTDLQRFTKFIQLDILSGCWEWQGYVGSRGYGKFWGGSRDYLSHRWIYEYYNDKIPKGLTIDHLCRNRLCCNPAHLEVVTNRENILRGIGIPAQNARKTHCPKGHGYTPENTYVDPRNCRHCRICELETRRRWRLRING